MSFIKGNDNDQTQALVRRVRNLIDEKEQAVGKREVPRAGVPSFPAASVDSQDVEIIQPEIWTPPRPGGTSFAPTSVAHYPPVIELPRWCSIYKNEKWLARYGNRNGVYAFINSGELPKHQESRYAEENVIALPSGFHTSREQCACCLTWTPKWAVGAIECRCGRVCYGAAGPDRLFVCRCGQSGYLGDGPSDRMGLAPGCGRGGNFGTSI